MAATAEQVKSEVEARFERALKGMETSAFRDEAEVAETRQYIADLKNLPAKAFKEENFLQSVWGVLTRLVEWAWATFKGALRWIGDVLKSALTFVERCLHGFVCIV